MILTLFCHHSKVVFSYLPVLLKLISSAEYGFSYLTTIFFFLSLSPKRVFTNFLKNPTEPNEVAVDRDSVVIFLYFFLQVIKLRSELGGYTTKRSDTFG